mmetsp:Transcript_3497/g.5140  ORF Transcript_3497/g.5140 Transcript_3497/m.5140 type:complete len:438 (+) Transcript_3497:115-1428(+)
MKRAFVILLLVLSIALFEGEYVYSRISQNIKNIFIKENMVEIHFKNSTLEIENLHVENVCNAQFPLIINKTNEKTTRHNSETKFNHNNEISYKDKNSRFVEYMEDLKITLKTSKLESYSRFAIASIKQFAGAKVSSGDIFFDFYTEERMKIYDACSKGMVYDQNVYLVGGKWNGIWQHLSAFNIIQVKWIDMNFKSKRLEYNDIYCSKGLNDNGMNIFIYGGKNQTHTNDEINIINLKQQNGDFTKNITVYDRFDSPNAFDMEVVHRSNQNEIVIIEWVEALKVHLINATKAITTRSIPFINEFITGYSVFVGHIYHAVFTTESQLMARIRWDTRSNFEEAVFESIAGTALNNQVYVPGLLLSPPDYTLFGIGGGKIQMIKGVNVTDIPLTLYTARNGFTHFSAFGSIFMIGGKHDQEVIGSLTAKIFHQLLFYDPN